MSRELQTEMNVLHTHETLVSNINNLHNHDCETNIHESTNVAEPEINNDTFIPGRFLYIEDECSRHMLQNAWDSITQLNLWDYLLVDTDNYMFNNDARLRAIYNKMEELGYYGHSGASFGWTMRQMQYIERHGEQNYKQLFGQS